MSLAQRRLPTPTPDGLDNAGSCARTRRATLAERWAVTPKALFFSIFFGSAAYLTVAARTFGLRGEQIGLCVAMVFTTFWNQRTRRLATALLPVFLVGIVYDLTHLTEPLVRYLHVHIAEPHTFDKVLFGIPTTEGRLTPNEFFARHYGPAVDFIAGCSYILYIYVAIGFALYLLLTQKTPEARTRLLRFGWTFFFVNLAGFVTYYVYPAAPPWYVTQHGFGPPDFTVLANPAAAARWDVLTGIPYFASFYGRSADVFGAIPSLHVTYPLLVWLYARELGRRWLSITTGLFFLTVSFSAVYLQHHYVLDVLLGSAYACGAYAVDKKIVARRKALREAARVKTALPA